MIVEVTNMCQIAYIAQLGRFVIPVFVGYVVIHLHLLVPPLSRSRFRSPSFSLSLSLRILVLDPVSTPPPDL